MDEEEVDQVKVIGEPQARELRAAALLAARVPVARLDAIGLEFVSLDPGERAVLPVRWEGLAGAWVIIGVAG